MSELGRMQILIDKNAALESKIKEMEAELSFHRTHAPKRRDHIVELEARLARVNDVLLIMKIEGMVPRYTTMIREALNQQEKEESS